MLPASGGQRPGMLQHILQCTEQPHIKNYLAQVVNSATARNSELAFLKQYFSSEPQTKK